MTNVCWVVGRTPAGCVRKSATWTCYRLPSTRPRSCTYSGTGSVPAETPAAVPGAANSDSHYSAPHGTVGK